MKFVERKKSHESAVKWVENARDRNDRERADWAGAKVRRYWDCAELLHQDPRWWKVSELMKELRCNRRLVRRTLEHLRAACIIELERGSTRIEGRARFRLTKLQERKR